MCLRGNMVWTYMLQLGTASPKCSGHPCHWMTCKVFQTTWQLENPQILYVGHSAGFAAGKTAARYWDQIVLAHTPIKLLYGTVRWRKMTIKVKVLESTVAAHYTILFHPQQPLFLGSTPYNAESLPSRCTTRTNQLVANQHGAWYISSWVLSLKAELRSPFCGGSCDLIGLSYHCDWKDRVCLFEFDQRACLLSDPSITT